MVTEASLSAVRSTCEPVRLDGREAMRWLRSRLRLRPGRTLVAIDGLPSAGKTSFADELADLLTDCGVETIRISLDDYGLTAGPASDSVRAFLEDVIEPLQSVGSGRYRTAITDKAGQHRWSCAADQAVVLVEGRYLHRACFNEPPGDLMWDLSVWLEVPVPEIRRRQLAKTSDEAASLADFEQTQLQYLRESDPMSRADLVVDNGGPHSPVD